MKKKNILFFISVILSMLETERVDKDFSTGIFICKKMLANMKLAFTNAYKNALKI